MHKKLTFKLLLGKLIFILVKIKKAFMDRRSIGLIIRIVVLHKWNACQCLIHFVSPMYLLAQGMGVSMLLPL